MIAIDKLSRYIINKSIDNGTPINNMQLQNLLHIIQVEFLRKRGERAFAEHTEAWKFGPVVPMAYYKFCYYGAMKIEDKFELDGEITANDLEIIDAVIKEYAGRDTLELSSELRRTGTAFDKIFQGGKGHCCIISPELMKELG